MKIPRQFTLAGTLWEVIEAPGLTEFGKCDSETARIMLRAELPEQIKAATFYHELVHAVKYTMGEDEHNEKEVDAMGNFLHQFATTCVYPKRRTRK